MRFTPLPDGGTIAVVAPSSRTHIDALAPATAWLEARGYKVKLHDQLHQSLHQSAGTVAQRAAALNEVLSDPHIDAVIAAIGGNRTGTILDYLDYAAINPGKPVLGFSDTTALLNAVHARTGLITLHGPSFRSLARGHLPAEEYDQMLTCLKGQGSAVPLRDAAILRPGAAQGRLIGGNLSVFTSLLGTPYMPDTTGALIFIEDVGDEMSRYDRMIGQLRLSGVLARAAGLIIGALDIAPETGRTPFGYRLEDILQDHLAGLDLPVVTGAPFGHGDHLYTLPIGAAARLDLQSGSPALHIAGFAG